MATSFLSVRPGGDLQDPLADVLQVLVSPDEPEVEHVVVGPLALGLVWHEPTLLGADPARYEVLAHEHLRRPLCVVYRSGELDEPGGEPSEHRHDQPLQR